jgi:hypothetical protein
VWLCYRIAAVGADHDVNGIVRPEIPIAPGERQFWRIVNAGADTYVNAQIDAQPLNIVALDGIPLGYYDAPRSIARGGPQARSTRRTRGIDRDGSSDGFARLSTLWLHVVIGARQNACAS